MDTSMWSRTLHEGGEIKVFEDEVVVPKHVTLALTSNAATPSAPVVIASSASAPPPVDGDARPKLKTMKGCLHPSSDASKAITMIFKLHLEKDEGVHMGVRCYRGSV
ncbi:hypothetical protein JCGZ_09703 [Jatropha curcas]|uniref:Uncharacterized protein n=1 Tax=Jatropha curcas TaxID=180498 RepID=A0A067LM20_JATCU|nr:hypothetical protein JCGZ_09703 [Jatropha curcas]